MTEKTKEKKTVWGSLSGVDVSPMTEEKGGFSYLSWAHAWGALKDEFPTATFHKHLYDGKPYMIDDNGWAYVGVTVEAGDMSQTEIYPVLNYANKAVNMPDPNEVNTALQRCLTKAISYLGLGHHVYAGEDLPTGAHAAPPQVSIVDLKGEVKEEAHDIILSGLKSFIADTKDEAGLTKLWQINQQAIKFLEGRDPAGHSKLLAEFSKAKKAYAAKENKE